jgi:coproporphyrinogen III oxidase-like Fe-S oxidoreductase
MIYTRPGQTNEAWRNELAEALDLAGNHLSLYQLTIEDGTPFAALHAAGKLIPPDDERAAELFALTQDLTTSAGLPAYEISNHARPGEESRHNLLYWRYGEYVGIGAGAHGRLIVDDGRHATSNFRQPERWLAEVERTGRGVETDEPLTARELTDEALLMGLRLTEGLDLGRLAGFGGGLPQQSVISALQSHGLLEIPGPGRIRASASGRFLLNGIILKLSDSLGS